MVIIPLYSFEYIACHSLFQMQSVSTPYIFFPVLSITQRTLDSQPAQNVTRPPDPETP